MESHAPVPIIYSPPPKPVCLGWPARLLAGAVALACLAILIVASRLKPAPAGTGTHEAIGFQPCQFLDRTGLPCPTCGMTTATAQFVRGHFLASLYLQPMGFVFALAACFAFWAGLYIALTARAAHRLLRRLPTDRILVGILLFAILAWGWKILIHLRGMDRWQT